MQMPQKNLISFQFCDSHLTTLIIVSLAVLNIDQCIYHVNHRFFRSYHIISPPFNIYNRNSLALYLCMGFWGFGEIGRAHV